MMLCLVAAMSAGTGAALARHPLQCASADEATALQTAAVQQELMDAALGCGDHALQQFNAFQIEYRNELRRSDRTLLAMFKRIHGSARGDAAYNLFKTNMASMAEIRRVHAKDDFCAAADLVFAAALSPDKPTLRDFVSGVQIEDVSAPGISACDVRVAVTLVGVQTGPFVVPRPNPLRVAAAAPPAADPVTMMPAPPPAAEPPKTPPPPPDDTKKKDSGWLSGIFH